MTFPLLILSGALNMLKLLRQLCYFLCSSMRSFNLESARQRAASILHLPDDFLNALTTVDEAIAPSQPLTVETLQKQQDTQQTPDNDTLGCRTCNVEFDPANKQEHRRHFTTDWHRYNIKRKVTLSLAPVSQEEFEEMLSGKKGRSRKDRILVV